MNNLYFLPLSSICGNPGSTFFFPSAPITTLKADFDKIKFSGSKAAVHPLSSFLGSTICLNDTPVWTSPPRTNTTFRRIHCKVRISTKKKRDIFVYLLSCHYQPKKHFTQITTNVPHYTETCNFTKSNTPPWVFFSTFSKLYNWYQIAQSVSYDSNNDLKCVNLF